MNTTISLFEYRLRYPDTAAVPTLTQSGLLVPLLERQRCKANRRLVRQACWRRRREAMEHAFAGLQRMAGFLFTPPADRNAIL